MEELGLTGAHIILMLELSVHVGWMCTHDYKMFKALIFVLPSSMWEHSCVQHASLAVYLN